MLLHDLLVLALVKVPLGLVAEVVAVLILRHPLSLLEISFVVDFLIPNPWLLFSNLVARLIFFVVRISDALQLIILDLMASLECLDGRKPLLGIKLHQVLLSRSIEVPIGLSSWTSIVLMTALAGSSVVLPICSKVLSSVGALVVRCTLLDS